MNGQSNGTYPRPQFVRNSFLPLDGSWSCSFTSNPEMPEHADQKILVPFAPECALSGVGRTLSPDEYLWYFRTLPALHAPFENARLLLHFTAVDQIAQLYVNRRYICTHIGGYLPFTADITDALSLTSDNLLAVRVQDSTDASYLSRGLQSLTPRRGTHEAMSGIWQSVWAEWVPPVYVRGLTITPEDDLSSVSVKVETNEPMSVKVFLYDNTDAHFTMAMGRTVPATQPLNALDLCKAGSDVRPCNMLSYQCYRASFRLLITAPHRWTPDDPYLYQLRIKAGDDEVFAYFALRHVCVRGDAIGTPRLHLNGKPFFLHAVETAGFWADSLLTAPAEKSFYFDLTQMKARGFNTVRIRSKIEPPQFYHLCDRIGLLVIQDMVSGGLSKDAARASFLDRFAAALLDKKTEGTRSLDADRDQWEHELRGTIEHLKSFPCIAVWNLFDEGKGQYESNRLTLIVSALDPSRPICQTTGDLDMGGGDIICPAMERNALRLLPDKRGRALIYSHVGDFSLAIPGHVKESALSKRYEFTSTAELNDAYEELMQKKILPLASNTLAGTIYTQWSDVGEDVNGIFTADRAVSKIYCGTAPV